jgi:hypothetical protein
MSIQKGKREIILLFTAALLLSIGIIISYNIKIGSERLPTQLFRICFLLMLMLFTYEGYGLAKWILNFCYIFFSLDIFLNRIHFSNMDYFYLFMGFFYAFIPVWLTFSKNINFFLNAKRNKT